MFEICESARCTGCAACSNSCAFDAITMVPDGEGFWHPAVDECRCTNCGNCRAACPVLCPPKLSPQTTKAYAAQNRDEAIRHDSTSGGVFSLLAQWILAKEGMVVGAAYGEDFFVQHTCITSEKELYRLRGAKYAQSEVGLVYRTVKDALESGKYVLFSGTPCQVAGLKNYLNRDYERLFCVDLICHGVPSPKVWKHYLDYRAVRDNSGRMPQEVSHRSKVSGWQQYSVVFKYGDSDYMCRAAENSYLRGFIGDLYLCSSCFQCGAKGIDRVSDFTLGDFWGISDHCPDMNDDKGTSLVLVHSEKAHAVWDTLCDSLRVKQVEPDAALRWNPMAIRSTPSQPKRESFFDAYGTENFDVLVQTLLPVERKDDGRRRSLAKRILQRIQRH